MIRRRRRAYNPKALYRYHQTDCAYCGNPMSLPWCGDYVVDVNKDDAPSRDHVIPLGRGGPDEEENMLIVCRRCNFLKGDLTLAEYHAHLVAEDSPEATRIAALLPRFSHLERYALTKEEPLCPSPTNESQPDDSGYDLILS